MTEKKFTLEKIDFGIVAIWHDEEGNELQLPWEDLMKLKRCPVCGKEL